MLIYNREKTGSKYGDRIFLEKDPVFAVQTPSTTRVETRVIEEKLDKIMNDLYNINIVII